jgi:hypothetical protein
VSTPRSSFIALALGSLWLAACGANQYNFARSYEPLADEQLHYDTAGVITYEEVKRDPNGFQTSEVAWFGVVTAVGDLPDGRTRLFLSLRSHQERHLCSDEREASCRVTVSARDLGPFSADVLLSKEEKLGTERVWVGSLVKIYGRPTGDYDDDGGPILDSKYHRHWPRGTYVTTAQRAGMRR